MAFYVFNHNPLFVDQAMAFFFNIRVNLSIGSLTIFDSVIFCHAHFWLFKSILDLLNNIHILQAELESHLEGPFC